MHSEIIVLRLIHILGGIFWLGSGLFVVIFLGPALAGIGPSAGAVMRGLLQRKFFVVLPLTGLFTVLSGIRLLWIDSGGQLGGYFATPTGRAFISAGAIGIIAFLVGIILVRPISMRTFALGDELAKATDDATRARLGAELATARAMSVKANAGVFGLLAITAAGMAVARYLG